MTSATTPKTIELYGHGIQTEAKALGAITPGMLVERATGGVQAHSTAQEGGQASFAQPYGLTGRGIDDAHQTDDQVVFKTYAAGSGVYALLPASAVAVTEGAFLVSNGDGTLRLQTGSSTATVVAQALEAVDNSGGSAVARIRVEVLPQFSVTA